MPGNRHQQKLKALDTVWTYQLASAVCNFSTNAGITAWLSGPEARDDKNVAARMISPLSSPVSTTMERASFALGGADSNRTRLTKKKPDKESFQGRTCMFSRKPSRYHDEMAH